MTNSKWFKNFENIQSWFWAYRVKIFRNYDVIITFYNHSLAHNSQFLFENFTTSSKGSETYKNSEKKSLELNQNSNEYSFDYFERIFGIFVLALIIALQILYIHAISQN